MHNMATMWATMWVLHVRYILDSMLWNSFRVTQIQAGSSSSSAAVAVAVGVEEIDQIHPALWYSFT